MVNVIYFKNKCCVGLLVFALCCIIISCHEEEQPDVVSPSLPPNTLPTDSLHNPYASSKNYWENPDSILYYFTVELHIEGERKTLEIAANKENWDELSGKELLRIPDYYPGYEGIPVTAISIAAFEVGSHSSAQGNGVQGIKEIIIPESIDSIGHFAFHNNQNVEKIQLPEGLRYLGVKAFADCYLLESINGENCWKIGSRLHCEPGPFMGTKISKVVFPPGMRRIPREICSRMGELTTVVWPETVESIGEEAFFYCLKLDPLPWSTNLRHIRYIGPFAFFELPQPQRYLDLLELDSLGDGAFGVQIWKLDDPTYDKSCFFKKVVLNKNLVRVYSSHCDYNYVIVDNKPSLHKDKWSIDKYTWYISELIIKEDSAWNVLQVSPFCRTSWIEKLVIPPNIKDISAWSFGVVDSLVITSVTNINYKAFSHEYFLTIPAPHFHEGNFGKEGIIVTCLPETPPQCNGFSFMKKKRLYVPASAIDAYRNATEWKDFPEIIGFDPKSISSTASE